jgi:serine/threonine protein phosphatase PrpC
LGGRLDKEAPIASEQNEDLVIESIVSDDVRVIGALDGHGGARCCTELGHIIVEELATLARRDESVQSDTLSTFQSLIFVVEAHPSSTRLLPCVRMDLSLCKAASPGCSSVKLLILCAPHVILTQHRQVRLTCAVGVMRDADAAWCAGKDADDSGAAATFCMIQGRNMTVAQLGDTRAVLLRGDEGAH